MPVTKHNLFTKKNTTYVYYTAEKKYLKDKGFNQNKRVCIGKLDTKNNAYFYPNEMYIQHFRMQNISIRENENKFSRTLSFGTKMVVEKVFEKLNLNQILTKVFAEKANLIESLVCYYLENQNSAIQLYEKWARRNALFTPNIDSNSTFSRLFNDIITSSKTNEFLYLWNQEFSKNSINSDIIMSLDTIRAKKIKKENKFFYCFVSTNSKSAQERAYMEKVSKRNNYDEEKYLEKQEYFGLIVFESNADLPLKEIYIAYKKRWEIEELFRTFKNILDQSEENVHGTYRVIASEFINFISTIMISRIKNYLTKLGLLEKNSLPKIFKYLNKIFMRRGIRKKETWARSKTLKYIEELA